MKLSNYNYFQTSGNNILLINTYSGCIELLNKKEYGELMNYSSLSSEMVEHYKQRGVLIEDEVDEWKIMRFDDSFYKNTSMPHYRILTSTGCNARCDYCYEKGMKVSTMNENTSEKVVEFISNTSQKTDTLHLEWFGGEPLVNISVIKTICKRLKEEGYSFKSTMVTNGILLNNKTIKFLKEETHLEKIQISLDGMSDYYESIRHVSKGTFDRVVDNIKCAADEDITVYIRLNLGENYRELEKLIDFAKSEIGFNKRIFWYIYPLFEKNKEYEKEKIKDVINLNKELVNSELMKMSDLYRFTYRESRCFATNTKGYTIAPDGKMFNCTHIMSDEEYSIGNIEEYSPYDSKRINFVSYDISEDCKECILYPNCKGGCRAAELKMADINQCNIYKSCLDEVAKHILDYYTKGGVHHDNY